MENPATARERRDEQNEAIYRQRYQDDHIAAGYEGRYVLINGGTPQGTYSTVTDTEMAELQLQKEKPLSPSTIVRIPPASS